MGFTYKGRYTPKHPAKYRGDPSRIIYRSAWERQLMAILDSHPSVAWWGSEELVIPYRDPLSGRVRRYFPDFVVGVTQPTGPVKVLVVEVKPYAQTVPPVPTPTSRQTRRYLTEVATWGTNQAKWVAAREFCRAKGWEFLVLTERQAKFL